jgi:hypothetical protein
VITRSLHPVARHELLEDARDVIALLLDELRTFQAPRGGHKALRSIYSPRGVCEVTHGACSPLCVAWHDALAVGAGWIDAYDRLEG